MPLTDQKVRGFFLWFFMKFLVYLFAFILALSNGAYAQTTADAAAAANMQRAVGGIVQSTLSTRGYVPSSPTTYNTLVGIGGAATVGAAAVGTGLLVGATLPAWGSILAVAAISGAVSYAVSLGIDKLTQWVFKPTGVAYSDNLPAGVILRGCGNTIGYPDCVAYSTVNEVCTPIGLINWAGQGTLSCVAQPKYIPASDLSAAGAAATASAKASPVDYDAMALLINDLWRKAALKPGYVGAPYTTPITPAEVQAWALANPGSYPTVGDLLAPVNVAGGGFTPLTTDAGGQAFAPPATTTTTPPTTTTVSPVTPDEPATAPADSPKTCGMPGAPPCVIDESGMPTKNDVDIAMSKNPSGIQKDIDDLIKNPAAFFPKLPDLNWSFALPTGCAIISIAAFAPFLTGIDICKFQPIFHDLMSVVWMLGGLFGAISLFMRNALST